MSGQPSEAEPGYSLIYNRRSGRVFRQVRIDGDPDLIDRAALLAEAFQADPDEILEVLSIGEKIMLGEDDLPAGGKYRESVLREKLGELGISESQANTLLGKLINEVSNHLATRPGEGRLPSAIFSELYDRMNSAPTASESD